jgi:hypothetical protein
MLQKLCQLADLGARSCEEAASCTKVKGEREGQQLIELELCTLCIRRSPGLPTELLLQPVAHAAQLCNALLLHYVGVSTLQGDNPLPFELESGKPIELIGFRVAVREALELRDALRELRVLVRDLTRLAASFMQVGSQLVERIMTNHDGCLRRRLRQMRRRPLLSQCALSRLSANLLLHVCREPHHHKQQESEKANPWATQPASAALAARP